MWMLIFGICFVCRLMITEWHKKRRETKRKRRIRFVCVFSRVCVCGVVWLSGGVRFSTRHTNVAAFFQVFGWGMTFKRWGYAKDIRCGGKEKETLSLFADIDRTTLSLFPLQEAFDFRGYYIVLLNRAGWLPPFFLFSRFFPSFFSCCFIIRPA